MQMAELPLYALISIDFDAVYERGPGALYSVFDINTLQVDLPKALGPEQVVDVLVATSTSFCMVDGNVLWPSTDFPSCTLTCSYQSVGVKRYRHGCLSQHLCRNGGCSVHQDMWGVLGLIHLLYFRRWRWWRLLRSTLPLLRMTRVLYMKVLHLWYRRSCDFHVISATYMRFGRSHGWAMPQSSKYRSRASRSLHAARGSQVVSPSVHLTSSSSSFEFKLF